MTNQFTTLNNIAIKNKRSKPPVGATMFMATICEKLKLDLSETDFTATEDMSDDFFLCITRRGNIDITEVADPIIK